MSIDKDEKESQGTNGKKASKAASPGSKKVTMQQSAQTFGAGKSKKPEYPKHDNVMITDALSDVRVK